ncbi:MAG: APC family permease [Tepidisphaeraceae bacterium]|jgi:amino acid transporter
MSVVDFCFGRRLASDEQSGQKIGVLSGLPALGLDGLSSSAYGPEAALTIMLPLGAVGLNYILPITGVILALLAMLYVSYRQTIAAYPVNGGSYTVARENLGIWASLFAAAALMIDYVLTVAVGISAGVAALVSAAPQFHKYTVPLCLGILALITLLNLRGTGQAGAAFALPTYLFIASMFVVLGLGVAKSVSSSGHPHPLAAPPAMPAATASVGIWFLFQSFASGCTAMTGVEAVSNGVSAFKEPTVMRAHRTLTLIVVILAMLLGGIAYLSHAYQIGATIQDQSDYQSVLSQLVRAVVGKGWFYYTTMGSVLAVLCLSANTSFVDFPRLCRLIAKDDFLPRIFAAVDRRLVYAVGVLFLATASGLLLAAFRGITDRLIPLYAVGAFLAFTLSQSGMVMHWYKRMRESSKPEPKCSEGSSNGDQGQSKRGRASLHLKLWVNGLGAVATATALSVILAAKFIEGAWITVLAIPTMLTMFQLVHRHYLSVEKQIESADPMDVTHEEPPVVLVPIHCWDRLVAKAVRFGMLLSADIIAVHLSNLEGDAAEDEASQMRQLWAERVEGPTRGAGVLSPTLEMVRTPYREFITPLLQHIDVIKGRYPRRLVVVIVPEIVEKRWWYALLHSRRASRLRSALRARRDVRVIVIDLPWFIKD